MSRPNHSNPVDACCSCGEVHPTPADETKPKPNELGVWQPNPTDPPQWICSKCGARLLADSKRNA